MLGRDRMRYHHQHSFLVVESRKTTLISEEWKHYVIFVYAEVKGTEAFLKFWLTDRQFMLQESELR